MIKKWVRTPQVAMTAILCLAALELYALNQHIDGAMFGAITAAIAGIAGYATRPKKEP